MDAFTPPNRIRPGGTSLAIEENRISATCQGWQVVTAMYSMNPARASAFSVKIVENSNAKGGLAIGLIGKPPTGHAIHQITLPTGILYNSNNGVAASQVIETNDAQKGLPFMEGSTVTVKFEPRERNVQWSMNGQCLGQCTVKEIEEAYELFPCFALFSPGQVIQVKFNAT